MSDPLRVSIATPVSQLLLVVQLSFTPKLNTKVEILNFMAVTLVWPERDAV
jgi:hypothetical protein